MTTSISSKQTHGIAYVVADNSGEAYEKVRGYLDDNQIGFCSDRCLDKVELIAEDENYPDCGIKLYR